MEYVIAAVGRAKAGPERQIFDEYIKRLKTKVRLKEVEERRQLPVKERQRSEADKLMSAIPGGSLLIVLDRTGNELSSEAFAEKLIKWQSLGRPAISFVIGGSDGFDQSILDRADARISFGKMTWPHMLARAFLAEQLYRSQCIDEGHPYHK